MRACGESLEDIQWAGKGSKYGDHFHPKLGQIEELGDALLTHRQEDLYDNQVQRSEFLKQLDC